LTAWPDKTRAKARIHEFDSDHSLTDPASKVHSMITKLLFC
jgi:hypothetical protein